MRDARKERRLGTITVAPNISDMADPASDRSHLYYLSAVERPMIDRAQGINIWDKTGKRYIDGSSGALVANLGHSHPRVLEAMRKQMESCTFAYRLHFKSEAAEQYATDLADALPGDLERIFFVSGGSEAVESALKLARQYAIATGQEARHKVLSLDPSYHGSTMGSLSVTGHAHRVDPFAPMLHGMPRVPAPTAYRDNDKLSIDERGLRYAALLEQLILTEDPSTVLAFIFEPVGGAATGSHVAPNSYYPAIHEICERHGVLVIYDEVMSGAGRTGRYLAAEHWGQQPDIVALSKGLGAGYVPLGAMVSSNRIVDPVLAKGGFIHGHTYAGNPLACAAGQAILSEIQESDLCTNAELMGRELMAQLESLKSRHSFIGDARGKGLLTAIELVSDPETFAVLPPELRAADTLTELCYERGLIVYPGRNRGGYKGDHVQVGPPMIVSKTEIGEIVDILDDALVAFGRWLIDQPQAL